MLVGRRARYYFIRRAEEERLAEDSSSAIPAEEKSSECTQMREQRVREQAEAGRVAVWRQLKNYTVKLITIQIGAALVVVVL